MSSIEIIDDLTAKQVKHETETLASEKLEKIPEPTSIKEALGSEVQKALELDPETEKQANALVEQFLNIDPQDGNVTHEAKQAVETMGADAQIEAARTSDMLKQTNLHTLSKRSEDGGEIADDLINLKMQVEALEPPHLDFSPGWFARVLGYLPFIGTPIKRYISKFETGSTVINAIKQSLINGGEQLKRDNITLYDDQKRMRVSNTRLEKAIKLGMAIQQKLTDQLATMSTSDPRLSFLKDEILFPLNQRIMDLQQQLAVNQQGILALEILIRNNKELIRGVDRTVRVTVTALSIGATVAIGLSNQKMILDKVQAAAETANSLIAKNAQMLKEQGAAIHKQATKPTVDLQVLKQSFANIKSALDDISTFRQDALPKMAGAIIELDKMTSEQELAIRELSKGNKASGQFNIDI